MMNTDINRFCLGLDDINFSILVTVRYRMV